MPFNVNAPSARSGPEGAIANRLRPELTALPEADSWTATSGRNAVDRVAVSVTTSPRSTRSAPVGTRGRSLVDNVPTVTAEPAQSWETAPPR